MLELKAETALLFSIFLLAFQGSDTGKILLPCYKQDLLQLFWGAAIVELGLAGWCEESRKEEEIISYEQNTLGHPVSTVADKWCNFVPG